MRGIAEYIVKRHGVCREAVDKCGFKLAFDKVQGCKYAQYILDCCCWWYSICCGEVWDVGEGLRGELEYR